MREGARQIDSFTSLARLSTRSTGSHDAGSASADTSARELASTRHPHRRVRRHRHRHRHRDARDGVGVDAS
jgi:hypothetical protein